MKNKKIWSVCLALVLLLTTLVPAFAQPVTPERRGVWIAYFELQKLMQNKSEKQFRDNFTQVLTNVKASGLDTLYVQVRPFGDALYPSKLFPWSYLATGKEGVKPTYDPMQIMVDMTHAQQLRFEAWVNPYRIRSTSVKHAMSTDNLASLWQKDNSGRVLTLSSGIFYNPSSPDVTKLVTDGITELVKTYAVDGVQFDDYFYPTTATSIDATFYKAYLGTGGKMKLADWRRDQVNQMVQSVYKAIKAARSTTEFGISPQGIMKNNYDGQYADVTKWMTNDGYVDYILPQVYFGIKNSKQPYEVTIKQWQTLAQKSKVKVYIGLAAYKLGQADPYAGTGKDEWQKNPTLLSDMIQLERSLGFGGYALFRYDSLFNPDKKLKDWTGQALTGIKTLNGIQ